jgi:hypothetical protein
LYEENIAIENPKTITWPAGTYSYKGNVTGNANYSSNSTGATYYIIVNKATPILSLTGSNATYNSSVNIQASESNNGDDLCIYRLYRNSTLVGTGSSVSDTSQISAGWYTYVYNTSGCSNYASNSTSLSINMSKGVINIDMWLNNDLNSDNTSTYPTLTNVTCKINITNQNNFTLYQNGTEKDSQSGQIIEYDITLLAGTYNFTCYYAATQNYTSYTRKQILTIDPLGGYCPSGETAGSCMVCTNGTNVNNCTSCDITNMSAAIYNPTGSFAANVYLAYQSETGTCGTTPTTNESWSKNVGYTYCSEEGNYNAVIYVKNTTGSWEYSENKTLYTINWDSDQNWCECKMGVGYWNVGGDVSNCCQDDSGEYKLSRDCSPGICNSSSADVACCSSNVKCVYSSVCYESGYSGDVDGDSIEEECVSGQWSNITAINVSCEAGGPYSTNANILVVGNTNSSTGGPVQASITVQLNDSLEQSKSTTGSADGKYNVLFSSLSVGTYLANVSATYGGLTELCNDIFIVSSSLTCTEKTVSLSGQALDFTTGQVISSGTFDILIEQTGDTETGNVTNGIWSVDFNTCLITGNRYTLAIKINSTDGRNSWSQSEFIAT